MENNECRIMVVDDSDFSRTNISRMLTEADFNVIGEAASAKDAIGILKDRKAHIVIVDVVMPEISGIELAETLNENFSDISIVMISSLAQESIVIESISAGAIDFIQKPFDKQTLLNSIEKISINLKDES